LGQTPDLWYLKNDNPDFSEHQGRNIIFCRTGEGEEIVKKACESGCLVIKDCSEIMPNFEKYQPYQFSRRVTMKYRLLALRMFFRFAPKYDRSLLQQASTYSTKEMNWSIFKGTVKRILQGKL
jgi:coenzyme F420 hydrogenase subunit beta